MDIEPIQTVCARVREQVRKTVVGQDAALDLMLAALLSEGHVLLEGVPGTAKTLLAQSFARALSLDFGRIQFTPDLMPGDVLGTNLFNFQTSDFRLTKGPIFTQVLLADEINRTPPKTQAALLQAMHERHVTIDGATHDLGERPEPDQAERVPRQRGERRHHGGDAEADEEHSTMAIEVAQLAEDRE